MRQKQPGASPLHLAIALVRIWTRVYTCGMDPDPRDRRRAEIASDLFECQQEAAQLGSVRAAAHVLVRVVSGAVDDIRWRVEGTTASAAPIAIAGVSATIAAIAVVLAWWGMGVSARRPPPEPTIEVFIGAPHPPPPPPPQTGIAGSQRKRR